jgi:hypothetical protein
MTIKYNWRDLAKRIINGREVEKVIYNWTQIRPSQSPTPNYLCFTAESANSTVKLNKRWNTTDVSLEISNNWTTWNDYTIWSTITLSNIGDSIYFRNKSETQTGFSTSYQNRYYFSMTGTISASGDINYLLCKNSTTTLSNYCFCELFDYCSALVSAPLLPATTLALSCYAGMFRGCTSLGIAPILSATVLAFGCYDSMFESCTSLTTPPLLPATTLADYCYWSMFIFCTSLTSIPSLPATTLADSCYVDMFYWCDNIKISVTQTWEYQNQYRIPTTWTWTTALESLAFMFENTWWTFTWTPSINQTYYTSNTVI